MLTDKNLYYSSIRTLGQYLLDSKVFFGYIRDHSKINKFIGLSEYKQGEYKL